MLFYFRFVNLVKVHVSDLQITPFHSETIGLGLWKNKQLALFLELSILFGGFLVYAPLQPAIIWSCALTIIHVSLFGFMFVLQSKPGYCNVWARATFSQRQTYFNDPCNGRNVCSCLFLRPS